MKSAISSTKRQQPGFIPSLTAVIFTLLSVCSYAQDLTVTVTDVKSEKGNLVLSVFKDSESFDQEKPFKKFTYPKKGLKDGILKVTCKLEPGTYGIALIDDENGDSELAKNMIGVPKEGFGFSNFFLTKMKKPEFNEFKFVLQQPGSEVKIKVKYM